MKGSTSEKFISSLSEFIQYLCSRYVTFDSDIVLQGHLYLSVDADDKTQFVVNEKLKTSDQNRVIHVSHSHQSNDSSLKPSNNGVGRPSKRKAGPRSGGRTVNLSKRHKTGDTKRVETFSSLSCVL